MGGLTTQPGRSVAGDMGLYYQKDFTLKVQPQPIPLTVRWGVAISNIGAKMAYTASGQKDFLPATSGWAIAAFFTARLNDFNT